MRRETRASNSHGKLDVKLRNGFSEARGADGTRRLLVREPRRLMTEVAVHLLRRRGDLSLDEKAYVARHMDARRVEALLNLTTTERPAWLLNGLIEAEYDEGAGWRVH